MLRFPRFLTISVAAAGCLALAACGSSGTSASDSATHSAAPSAAAYPTQDVVSGISEDAKLHAELPASVRSSGTLTLGTTQFTGTAGLPYAGEGTNGQAVGIQPDIENAVAQVLGVHWSTSYGTFDTIIPGVQNGRFEVGVDNFGVTAAREQVVDFSTYLSDGQSLLVPSSSSLSTVTSITDLCGLTIGTGAGTTFQEILTKDAAKCAAAGKTPYKVDYFADQAPIILGLENGKLDVYFGPTLGVKYEAAHLPGLRFAGQFSQTPVGFVTDKGSALAPVLSAAVNELIADGEYAKILAKWGVATSGITQSQVNPTGTGLLG
ncbi:MAG: transporter substrate-binding domain-containing protein [Streptosporangiaceae bacterium]